MTDVVVALDAGGSKLLGGLLTRDGEVLAREQVPTPRGDDGRCDPGLRALQALASRLVERAGHGGLRVRGAGLGIAEYVRGDEVTSTEVFDWQDQPTEVLAPLAGPVGVEADVRCAARAEAAALGLGEDSSMAYVSWGTGLSSTLVLGGRCVAGARGEALALGAWPVDTWADPGWSGTLEGFASGRGIEERYRTRTSSPRPGAEVARLADEGDLDAGCVVDSAAEAVARAVASLVCVLDPDLVVLGGGIGSGGGRLATLTTDLVPRLLERPDPPPVRPARTGADAGLIGAGLVGWQAAVA